LAHYLPQVEVASHNFIARQPLQTWRYTGTPALIIPTYSGRESNARRVTAQGAGDFVLLSSDVTGKTSG
jgi:hypothetical protein